MSLQNIWRCFVTTSEYDFFESHGEKKKTSPQWNEVTN